MKLVRSAPYYRLLNEINVSKFMYMEKDAKPNNGGRYIIKSGGEPFGICRLSCDHE